MRRQVVATALAIGLAVAAMVGGLAACRDDEPAPPAGSGVTREPCPNAVDRAKGCVYLGLITDPGAGPQAVAFTDAQQRFWDRVNKAGGIGGYEIDAVT
mgnify:CR=1 FL=1